MAAADNSIGFQAGLRLAWLSALSHSVTSLAETLAPLRECSRQALAAGNITAGIIAALIYVQHATTAMSHYDALHEDLLRSGNGVAWQGLDALRLDYLLELQFLENIRGRSVDPIQLTGSYWDERSMQGNQTATITPPFSPLSACSRPILLTCTRTTRSHSGMRIPPGPFSPATHSCMPILPHSPLIRGSAWLWLASRPRAGAGSC